MTEEEYFIKNYPDVCYGDKPLSPYWDFFQAGVEFGERQSEEKIKELKAELTKKADTNHSLVEQMADLEGENAELKKWQKDTIKARGNDYMDWSRMKDQLTKAVELLKWALHADPEHDDLVDFDTKWKEAEQFIKEIEK